MKTKILPLIICAVLTGYITNTNAQANTSLSNLTSPTAINQNLLPNTTNSRNLGNSNSQWQYLYLYGRIYLNGAPAFHAHGTGNFFAGPYAGSTTLTGTHNTGIGEYALNKIVIGENNTALGEYALYNNDGESFNTAVGYKALYTNVYGFSNTAIGDEALTSNYGGVYNTAIGELCLGANSSGTYNTGTGYGALRLTTEGDFNTATGSQSLNDNTTGNYNTAVGSSSLFQNSSGYGNSAFGTEAGSDLLTGNQNIFIGYFASCSSQASFSNSIAIGYNSLVNAGNIVRIGNSSITSIGGYVNWSNISDGRVKKNIQSNVPGLAFINKLNPVTYHLDLDAADKILQKPALKDKDGKLIQPSANELASRKAKEQIVYSGFVAQDVEKTAKELNYDFSGVDAAKNDKDLYGLRYADFVVPLVKAVQELSVKNDSLQNLNNNLEKRIERLEAMMNVQQTISSSQSSNIISITNATLEQNIPNPFNHTTIIHYTLPQQFIAAQIIITDNSGKFLKQLNISGTGKGSVTVDASTLSSESYNYSLIVDGKLIATKQMLLAK